MVSHPGKKSPDLLNEPCKSADSTPFVLGALLSVFFFWWFFVCVFFLKKIKVDRNKRYRGVDCAFYGAVLAVVTFCA